MLPRTFDSSVPVSPPTRLFLATVAQRVPTRVPGRDRSRQGVSEASARVSHHGPRFGRGSAATSSGWQKIGSRGKTPPTLWVHAVGNRHDVCLCSLPQRHGSNRSSRTGWRLPLQQEVVGPRSAAPWVVFAEKLEGVVRGGKVLAFYRKNFFFGHS